MGSEMCIRDSVGPVPQAGCGHAARAHDLVDLGHGAARGKRFRRCLLYTSDAADERSSVDLGGRRIIKKKKHKKNTCRLSYISLIHDT